MKAEQDALDVRRVLAGETAAFEAIVRRWQGPLVNLAYRFCRDRGRAEEMAQDAFLKIFNALPTWRGDAAFDQHAGGAVQLRMTEQPNARTDERYRLDPARAGKLQRKIQRCASAPDHEQVPRRRLANWWR